VVERLDQVPADQYRVLDLPGAVAADLPVAQADLTLVVQAGRDAGRAERGRGRLEQRAQPVRAGRQIWKKSWRSSRYTGPPPTIRR